MGMTMTEKILAAHAGLPEVHPGDVITCKVDWAANADMFFTVSGQIDYEKIIKVDDPEKCGIFLDHAVPAPTETDAIGAIKAREFAEKHKISSFFDVGNHGVVHQKIAESGFARPGRLLACGDSHTCAAGAFNCAARGFGPADMVYTWCKGENWYQVSPTILYNLTGRLQDRVMGKDLFLYIAGVFGDVQNANVEFGGDGIKNLPINERQSISAMCAEINAEFAIFPYDDAVKAYLQDIGVTEYDPVYPDESANYLDVREINLDKLVPYVAKPDFIPGNCVPVTEMEGYKIHQVLIGSCSNGRVEDLKVAAEIMKGKHVAKGVRLIVTPASQKEYLKAVRAGYIETLVESGAVITNPTCGACYGGHLGLIGPGECCLSTTTRNFKARMGSPESKILLSSPATAAASALAGKLTDPRNI